MKRIYGALSPFDNKTICYTWQELSDEIKKFRSQKSTGDSDDYGIEEYQLRFRQMKSVMLREGLVEKINKKFRSWFSEVDNIDYVDDCRRYTKKLDLADKIDLFLRNNYDLNRVGGCFYDILFMGYLRSDYELIMIRDPVEFSTLWEAAYHYLNMNGSRKTYKQLARDNSVSEPMTKDANELPIYFILRELRKVDQKRFGADRVSIVIDKRLTERRLIQSIHKLWPEMSKLVDKLPVDEVDEHLPSIRNLRIVELRDILNLKFKDIPDKITEEFNLDDSEATIDEDTVKSAYHRAHESLSLLIPER